jgi:LAS superfamily LD-carboxypeptidase LdcB
MEIKQSTFKQFLDHTRRHHWILGTTSLVLIAAVGFGFWYGYLRNETLTMQVKMLSLQLNNLESILGVTTDTLKENISKAETTFSQEQQNIKNQFGEFQGEVKEISGTVSTLDKLSKIDPELLQKYSKVFFLNEHYVPETLREVPNENKYYEQNSYQIHAKVWPHLIEMLNQAAAEREKIYVRSAYRSFGTQATLKGNYIVTYGAGTANQFSADQGYSEHQLGTTVDLITIGINGTLTGFETTSAYQWLLKNAHQYGFTLSYPENNTYYIFEPWHWRYVGKKLATYLYDANKHFYDLDQREIDGYLISIFD